MSLDEERAHEVQKGAAAVIIIDLSMLFDLPGRFQQEKSGQAPAAAGTSLSGFYICYNTL
jgi:hypothetical protein